MNWFTKGLFVLGSIASARLSQSITLPESTPRPDSSEITSAEHDSIDACKSLITSEPLYLDMCRRSCDNTVSSGKCVGKSNGAELAACVNQNYPYCTVIGSDNKVESECKMNITSEPAYLDMCRRNCDNVVSSGKCVGKSSGAELAACVNKNYPYCTVIGSDNKIESECKMNITSEPVYLDMCRRNCDNVVSSGKCVGKSSGAELAACVNQNYPYCTVAAN